MVELYQRNFRNLNSSWLQGGNPDGELLVFLHGFPDNAEIWKPQLEYFQEKYCVVSPYLRGTFPSQESPRVTRYGLHSISLDLLELLQFLDPLGQRRLNLVGHDLGACHAWQMSTLLGARLNSLIILNGLSLKQMTRRLKVPEQWVRSWYIPLMWVPFLPDKLFQTFAPQLEKFAHDLGGLRTGYSIPEPEKALPFSLNQYRAFLTEVGGALKTPASPFTGKLLVLWGNQDPFLCVPEVSEFEEDALNIEVRIIEGSHWLQQDKAVDVNRIINDFLRRSP